MAACKKPAAKCAKKAPADVKAVKPAAAGKVKGGMSKTDAMADPASFKFRLR